MPLSSRHPGARGGFPFLAPLWKAVPRCLLLHSPSLRPTHSLAGVTCPRPPRPAPAEGQVGLGAPESEQQRGGTRGGGQQRQTAAGPAARPPARLGARRGLPRCFLRAAPPPTPQRRSIEMQPQKRPEADAASTFHPLHPGLMLNGAVFLSELSGPSATPRGEMTAPSSPQLQGGTQRGGRTHSVLPSRRLRLSGAELGERRALAGWGCGRGSSGGVPPPSFCRPDRSAPGERRAGGTTDGWARRSVRRTGGSAAQTGTACRACVSRASGDQGTGGPVQTRPGPLGRSGLSL